MFLGGEELERRRGRRVGRKLLSWRVLPRLLKAEVGDGLERIRRIVVMRSLSVLRLWTSWEEGWREVAEEGKEEEMVRGELRPELGRR